MSRTLKKAIEIAEGKREEVAEALLNWEAVEPAIRAAAASGARRVVLTPAAPIKIKHTAAAAAAIELLTREQFRHQWAEHRPAQGGPAGDQLEIEW